MKRLLFCVLLLLGLTALLPRVDAAATIASGELDTVSWEISDDGTLTVSGGPHIPESPEYNLLNYYDWQDHWDVVTRIVVADGIQTIPEGAFYHMSNVRSVYLSNTLTNIGPQSFEACGALEAVEIPATVTHIEFRAFYGCACLASVIFAEDCMLQEIGGYAFAGTGITSFYSPPNLRAIREGAFEDCWGLESVRLEGGISTMENCFENCYGLKTLYLGESLTKVEGTFHNCTHLEYVEIRCRPSCEIPDNRSLKTLVFGGRAMDIPDHAFENCNALTTVVMDAPIKHIGYNAFGGCSSLADVVFPDTLTEIESSAFQSSGLKRLVLPDSVTTVGESAFRGCPLLESVILGAGIETLERHTFAGCDDLTFVDLGNLKTVGNDAFSWCDSLSTVIWPDELEQILYGAFKHTALERVEFVPTLQKVEGYAFSECLALKTIIFRGDLPKVAGNALINVIATAYYPADNETWGESGRKGYAGNLTWRPICDAHTPVIQPEVKSCAGVSLTEGAYCDRCGITLTQIQTIPSLEHTFVTEIIDATCSQVGYYQHTCTGCGLVRLELYQELLDHQFEEWAATDTIFIDGGREHQRQCRSCDLIQTGIVPNYRGWETEPPDTNPPTTEPPATQPPATEPTVPATTQAAFTEPKTDTDTDKKSGNLFVWIGLGVGAFLGAAGGLLLLLLNRKRR